MIPEDTATTIDENLWLEDIHGEAPLAWAAEQTAATLARFASPEFDALTGRLLEVIDSDDRIPIVTRRGAHLYNFWRDAAHPRGLWRRTTLESYRADETEWDVLLDVDALGRAEDTEWVFAGSRLLPNDYSRALVALSPDGGDAVTVREFDVEARGFVADGFVIPTAKSSFSWIDRDTIYLGTDFGPGSMTDSSYPRTVRRLSRGQSLAEATLVHEVATTDLQVEAHRIHTPGYERDVVTEVLDFYRSRTYLLEDGGLVGLDIPDDSDSSIRKDLLFVQPRSDWAVGGTVHPTGSLIAIRLDDFLAGGRDFDRLFTPDAGTALESWDYTASRVILTLLENVSSRLVVLDPARGWASTELAGVPPLSTVRVLGTSPDEVENADAGRGEEYWLHTTGFTAPPAVLRGVLGGTGAPELVRSSPPFFDASGIEVQQHWVVSDDGTRVPYFQVAARGLVADGSHPTFINGYGGFQQSILANYNGVVGRAWLERGGVLVVANIRGGGEFGPAWHTAALKADRHRAYEDFAAVARDLVARGITVPARLGCEGRSNGGLLVGNMLTRYPELFGAVVCGVPLLDMKRYTHLSAGASWIAEYGDPDVPEEWEFIRTFSPYQLLDADTAYPPTLLYAATSDDRVGPVQARKMAARMHSLGIPDVWYFENTDGGHGGAVDNTNSARLFALMYDFLWRTLSH
jgi:prolyl oligopeptidase